MSDDFTLLDAESEAARDAAERRRSIQTMLIVLAFALVVSGVAVVLLVTNPGAYRTADNKLGAPTPSVQPSYAFDATSQRVIPSFTDTIAKPRILPPPTTASQSPTPTVHTSATGTPSAGVTSGTVNSAPRSTPRPPPTSSTAPTYPTFPCASRAPCAVGGYGGADTAVNNLRASRHLASVSVEISGRAQDCALGEITGDLSSCATPYADVWEYSQDGSAAAQAAANGGATWFFDRNLSLVEVGWAYDPGSGRYFCVFIAN